MLYQCWRRHVLKARVPCVRAHVHNSPTCPLTWPNQKARRIVAWRAHVQHPVSQPLPVSLKVQGITAIMQSCIRAVLMRTGLQLKLCACSNSTQLLSSKHTLQSRLQMYNSAALPHHLVKRHGNNPAPSTSNPYPITCNIHSTPDLPPKQSEI
jgi:hypothetical protein